MIVVHYLRVGWGIETGGVGHWNRWGGFIHHIDGLVQDCGISIALAMEIPVLH